MAEDHRGDRGYPLPREYTQESQYPPPPGEEDERHLPPAHMARGVTLPSIQDANAYAPPPLGRAYPPGPELGAYPQSPTANGYTQSPMQSFPLPRMQPPPSDPRPPYDYYAVAAQQRPPYPPPSDPYGYVRYAPQGHPPPGYGSFANDFPRMVASAPSPQQPSAPRQRTSIACRYCRKRKIRCSGYANTTNGKCINCDKLRIECIFQPVSSNSATAFVPVSAVPGGVPPGTPLYGAYGQPLPPAGVDQQVTPAQYGSSAGIDYPMPSPTTSQYAPQPSDPNEARKRHRRSEEELGPRLPPPNPYGEGERRQTRSPASNHSNGTPPAAYHPYPSVPYDGMPSDGDPRQQSHHAASMPPSGNSSSIMSLDNLIKTENRVRPESGHDIDRNMLGRLNSRSRPK